MTNTFTMNDDDLSAACVAMVDAANAARRDGHKNTEKRYLTLAQTMRTELYKQGIWGTSVDDCKSIFEVQNSVACRTLGAYFNSVPFCWINDGR